MPEAIFKDKVAFITGATQGIGRACALELASRGAHIVGIARNPEPAAELARDVAQAGGGLTFIRGDVSIWSECLRICDEAIAQHERVDILVNNAGISRPHARMEALTEQDWEDVSGPTLKGTIAMTRGVLPTMIAQKDGVVVNIASAAGLTGFEALGSYCMSKAAVIQHAKMVALENRTLGVRAHAMVVGLVETDAMRRSMQSQAAHNANAPASSDGQADYSGSRWAIKPEDVARAVALLCTKEARHISGGPISIDSGFTAGSFSSAFTTLLATGAVPF